MSIMKSSTVETTQKCDLIQTKYAKLSLTLLTQINHIWGAVAIASYAKAYSKDRHNLRITEG